MKSNPSILIIYTGGTIGMAEDPKTGELSPVNFEDISLQLPELVRFDLELHSITFSPPVDSSEINPDMWVEMAAAVGRNYEKYDGFVILHGTDTMAYSASALSFLLEDLDKPVIFTGSQLPIGMLRTDGRENLISSIEIAAARKNGRPLVPEVCIFFQNRLFRGNRTTKHNVEYFNAFRSENYPALAETGINIWYNYPAILQPAADRMLRVHTRMVTEIAVLKIFPGISERLMNTIYNMEGLRGVIMETYGAGNAPTGSWFIKIIKQAVEKGIVIVNVTQCATGSVDMTRYRTGKSLLEAGVHSGHDITVEAAVAKLMFLLAGNSYGADIGQLLNRSLRGEIFQ
jgi:L-asparaginase